MVNLSNTLYGIVLPPLMCQHWRGPPAAVHVREWGLRQRDDVNLAGGYWGHKSCPFCHSSIADQYRTFMSLACELRPLSA
jgi:hypothetical protein